MPLNLADKTTEDYIINTPREVSLDEREDGLEGLEIIDCDGRAHGLCVMGYASWVMRHLSCRLHRPDHLQQQFAVDQSDRLAWGKFRCVFGAFAT